MKETRLGDFEEVILLLVGILNEEAYAFKIAEEFESQQNEQYLSEQSTLHSTAWAKKDFSPQRWAPLPQSAVADASVFTPSLQRVRKY